MGDLTALAFQSAHLAERQLDLSGLDQRAHLVDAVGRGAEIVTAVEQRQAFRQRLQIERPVERRVATADDEQVVVAIVLHAAHGIEDRLALVGLDARDRRPLGLERATARRDHDHLAEKRDARVGGQAEAAVCLARQRLDHLAEMEGRMEGMDLLHQLLDQPLAGDDRIAGNVVDRLLRIELGALAARLVENVDERAADVEQAKLEDGEQPDRAGADDDHVGLDDLAGAIDLYACVVHSGTDCD